MKSTFKYTLNLFLSVFVLLSALASPTVSYGAGDCRTPFGGTPTSAPPAGMKYIKLEPGQQVWEMYTCKSCSSLVSARPNGNAQGCRNCGAPHSGEVTTPPESVLVDGRIHLIQSEQLVTKVDPSSKHAKSGAHWTCGFCQGTNFQFMVECDTCGGAKTGFAAPEVPEYLGPPDEFSNSDAKALAAKTAAAGATSAFQKSTFGSTTSATSSIKEVSVHQPGRLKAFLRTKAGALLLTGAATGAIGFIWWGTQTYTLPAEVTSVSADTTYISYQDKNGRPVTIDITPPDKSVSVKNWRVGDKVTLYFRNLGGAKGAEGFDGTVLVPKEKKK